MSLGDVLSYKESIQIPAEKNQMEAQPLHLTSPHPPTQPKFRNKAMNELYLIAEA